MKPIFICLFGGLLFFQFLSAHNNLRDSVHLDEIVVTGAKFETSRKLIPLSVSQISTQNIEQSGRYNVLQTLSAYVPGIFITERNILGFGVATGGSGAVNIRGVGGSPNTQVLVLIDGHPQYQGLFGHPLPDAYVSSDVEKVEIIRGPASVLYGSNAMAGAINIITRKQQKEGFSGSANAVYGSYNTQKYAATVGYKKDKFHLFASANYGSTDGTRENTDFRIMNGYLKGGYDWNEHWKIAADVNFAQYNANDNGPVYAPALFNIDILRGKTALSVENKYEKTEGAFKIYHNFGDHVLSDGFVSSDRNSGLMLYQTYHLFTTTHLTAGLDAKQFGGTANRGFSANQLKTINEFAGYSLVRQQLFKIVDFNAGLRFEYNSVYGKEWVPMAGAVLRAGKTSSLKTSLSKGFRSPTIMELYLYAPNPDLKPEKMMNYEIGWLQSFVGDKLSTELTTFMSKGENMIQVVGVGPTAKRQNVGVFTNTGVEFAIRYAPDSRFNMHANYTFLDMDKPVVGAPRQQLNAGLNYQYKMFNLNLNVQHVEELYPSVNPLRKQNFTLLNSRVSAKPQKNIEVFLAGHNLLNQTYEINDGYPMPEINFHGGLNINF
ncbi:MAG: TonB-dependent receptor [Paludibacter sp.]|nr:TonB-dependent receptor [Paludibacter sp.]